MQRHPISLSAAGLALALASQPGLAQSVDHSAHDHAAPAPAAASAPTPAQKGSAPAAAAGQQHRGHGHMPMMEHGSMQHGDRPMMDHGDMPHGEHRMMDHGGMQHGDRPMMDHGDMQHGEHRMMDHDGKSHAPHEKGEHKHHMHHGRGHGQTDAAGHAGALPAFIPVLTDADRAAAFPSLREQHMHGGHRHWMLAFNQFEYQDADEGSALAWDASGWIGGDLNRLWLRSEGERHNGTTEEAELQLLYGRAIGPWWEALAGVRQDFKPGSPQTWAAFGVQGMPLYALETEVTAFLGEGGQSALRLEAEYDILLTNRLILQPQVEVNFYGRNDPARGVGAGLANSEAGLRLRYEIVREFAPYIGVSWNRSYGNTADLLREEGGDRQETRFVAGVRFWF